MCRRPFGTITLVMVPNGRRHKQVLNTVGGGDEAAITRALKWHLCIHHLLLRAPSNAAVGSRQWLGTLRRRFGNWQDGDYVTLVGTLVLI